MDHLAAYVYLLLRILPFPFFAETNTVATFFRVPSWQIDYVCVPYLDRSLSIYGMK